MDLRRARWTKSCCRYALVVNCGPWAKPLGVSIPTRNNFYRLKLPSRNYFYGQTAVLWLGGKNDETKLEQQILLECVISSPVCTRLCRRKRWNAGSQSELQTRSRDTTDSLFGIQRCDARHECERNPDQARHALDKRRRPVLFRAFRKRNRADS